MTDPALALARQLLAVEREVEQRRQHRHHAAVHELQAAPDHLLQRRRPAAVGGRQDLHPPGGEPQILRQVGAVVERQRRAEHGDAEHDQVGGPFGQPQPGLAGQRRRGEAVAVGARIAGSAVGDAVIALGREPGPDRGGRRRRACHRPDDEQHTHAAEPVAPQQGGEAVQDRQQGRGRGGDLPPADAAGAVRADAEHLMADQHPHRIQVPGMDVGDPALERRQHQVVGLAVAVLGLVLREHDLPPGPVLHLPQLALVGVPGQVEQVGQERLTTGRVDGAQRRLRQAGLDLADRVAGEAPPAQRAAAQGPQDPLDHHPLLD